MSFYCAIDKVAFEYLKTRFTTSISKTIFSTPSKVIFRYGEDDSTDTTIILVSRFSSKKLVGKEVTGYYYSDISSFKDFKLPLNTPPSLISKV